MSLLSKIVRKYHCRNTYQRFAIDALAHVQTDAGRRLANWLLRHYRLYLLGAIDPDRRFKDYQNQVIHADQGYWGGAPRVAHQWYDRLQTHLTRGEYTHAARAAGVLCHYFTDPTEPLHTAYSTRESVVHRPLANSYDSLLKLWKSNPNRIVHRLPEGHGWLEAAMVNSARIANRRFNLLVDSYQLNAALKNPEDGLTTGMRVAIAEAMGLAITGWARVIERAAYDCETLLEHKLPTPHSTMPYFFSVSCIPIGWWQHRVARCIEETEVKKLAKEYRRHGRLDKHLPNEVDIKKRVMDVFQQDQEYRQKQSEHRHHQNCTLLEALQISKQEADKMRAAGVENLRDLITNHAGYLADQVDVYWIDKRKIESWQRKASELCGLPYFGSASRKAG